jgi:hypothetical protein
MRMIMFAYFKEPEEGSLDQFSGDGIHYLVVYVLNSLI